jgi:predicted DNA binding CopG/RHH family protein
MQNDGSQERRGTRTGTEVRRRDALVGVRLTQREMAVIKEAAAREGTSPASVLREAFFATLAAG